MLPSPTTVRRTTTPTAATRRTSTRASSLVGSTLLVAALTVACTHAGRSGSPAGTSPASPGAATSGAGTTSPVPTATHTSSDPAQAALRRLTLAQRVGQLLMVGSPATSAASSARGAITDRHVGSVMLTGRSAAGTRATAAVAAALTRRATTAATGGVPLFVATDQEGGAVKVLSGPGFTSMPRALTQGGWAPADLQSAAHAWGVQLRAAGVNLNLAPVADTVPTASRRSNRPIGVFGREFGSDPATVGQHVVAFGRGMQEAGVVPTVKHFPGLGRVTGNTDTSSRVTDSATSATSAYLQPFRDAIASGAPVVMMSSAYYARIDPARPACFSRTVVTDLLRGRLGFTGVVISDDLGRARAVQRWSPGARAVQFVEAGGDVVLTVDPSTAPAMQRALYVKARDDAGFRAVLDAAALRVLQAKAAAGLLD